MSISFKSKAPLQAKVPRNGILRKSDSSCYLIAALTFSLVSTGCLSAINTSSSTGASTKAPNVFPLTFKEHNFEVYCYNTLHCRVIYNNFNFTLGGEEESPSGAPYTPDYRKSWNASYAGVRNFPPPAEVRWTSLDGSTHEAKIDIGEIFKDERVLHNVLESDYAEGSFGGSPSIFLEVNDRTVNVYMEAYIATKTKQVPGNENSTHRYDLILAWSHTY